MKKKILIISHNYDVFSSKSNRQHITWVHDCCKDYEIDGWGPAGPKEHQFSSGPYGVPNLKSLMRKIDSFKPDFIYLTLRRRYDSWLPDMSSIKSIPKIFVEVDNLFYNRNDDWYDQFTHLYCRQPWWDKKLIHATDKDRKSDEFKLVMSNVKTWKNVPHFKWPIPESRIDILKTLGKVKRVGAFFVGRLHHKRNFYLARQSMAKRFKGKVDFVEAKGPAYWDMLYGAESLVCPAEHRFGGYVPQKLFEYVCSGARVFTNCDLERYGIKDVSDIVVRYNDWDQLDSFLEKSDSPDIEKIIDVMSEHTHRKRYEEIFVG